MSDFTAWLNQKLKAQGWSNSELARRAGISQATVSIVINDQHTPSFDFCVKIAGALGERPEGLLRMAGLLPALPGIDDDASISETLDIMKRLTPEERRMVLEYAAWRYEKQQGR